MITCPKLIKLKMAKKPPLQQQYWFPGPPNGFWFWMNDGISPKLIFHLVLGGKTPPCPKKSTTFEALFAVTINTLINLIIYLHQPKSNKQCVSFSPLNPVKTVCPFGGWFFHQFPTAGPIFRTKKKKQRKVGSERGMFEVESSSKGREVEVSDHTLLEGFEKKNWGVGG